MPNSQRRVPGMTLGKKTCSLEVTDATKLSMTLRALVSSSDATKNWALRCFVRERLVAFLGTLDAGAYQIHRFLFR